MFTVLSMAPRPGMKTGSLHNPQDGCKYYESPELYYRF
jgi:hypothetical protein